MNNVINFLFTSVFLVFSISVSAEFTTSNSGVTSDGNRYTFESSDSDRTINILIEDFEYDSELVEVFYSFSRKGGERIVSVVIGQSNLSFDRTVSVSASGQENLIYQSIGGRDNEGRTNLINLADCDTSITQRLAISGDTLLVFASVERQLNSILKEESLKRGTDFSVDSIFNITNALMADNIYANSSSHNEFNAFSSSGDFVSASSSGCTVTCLSVLGTTAAAVMSGGVLAPVSYINAAACGVCSAIQFESGSGGGTSRSDLMDSIHGSGNWICIVEKDGSSTCYAVETSRNEAGIFPH